MTSPDSGSPRSGRIAGVALLGLAAVALVIGLITALGGNGDGRADGGTPPSSATSTITGPPSTKPTSKPPTTSKTTSVPPSSGTTTTTTTTTGGGGGSQTQPPGGDGNGEPAKSVPVRVYNNSKIKGLAARAAADLRAVGWQVTEVANYPYGTIPTTTVYYRPGTEEEAAAKSIGAEFGMKAEPRFEGIKDAPGGVIVIVTNDYQDAGGGGKNEG
jgi:hypothetical protein